MFHMGLSTYIPPIIYGLGFIIMLLSIGSKTQLGIVFLTFLIPLQNVLEKLKPFPFGKDFIDLMLLSILCGWVLKSLSSKQPFWDKNRFSLVVFLIIILSYVGLWRGSSMLGLPPPLDLQDARFMNWKNFVILPVLFFITFNNITDKKWIKATILAMTISMLIMDFVFINQFRWLKRFHFSNSMRISGTFSYLGPNELAAFYAQYTFVIFALLLYCKGLFRYFLSGIFLLNMYCLVFSFSRAGYLSFLSGSIVFSLIKNKKLLIPIAILVLCYKIVLPVSVVERIEMTEPSNRIEQSIQKDTSDAEENISGEKKFDQSAENRLMFWRYALEQFYKHPILGTGFNTFIYLNPYKMDTHNNYLKVLSEIGIFGFLLFVYFLCSSCFAGWSLFKISREPFLKGLGIGFLCCGISCVVGNMFGDKWSYLNLMGYFWILLALVLRAEALEQSNA